HSDASVGSECQYSQLHLRRVRIEAWRWQYHEVRAVRRRRYHRDAVYSHVHESDGRLRLCRWRTGAWRRVQGARYRQLGQHRRFAAADDDVREERRMLIRLFDIERLAFMVTTAQRSYLVTSAITAALVLGTPTAARAQATAQIPLQFDFLDPGARSLALGSAFIAVADDATAAFTNPAGLTFMVKPEVSAELR